MLNISKAYLLQYKTDKELKPDPSKRVNVPSDYNMQFIYGGGIFLNQ